MEERGHRRSEAQTDRAACLASPPGSRRGPSCCDGGGQIAATEAKRSRKLAGHPEEHT